MVVRRVHLDRIAGLFSQFPVVAILGPRQIGKTTLSRQYAETVSGPVHHFDLEQPATLRRLQDPMLALEDLRGLVILDEIQRQADVFPVLRVIHAGKERFRLTPQIEALPLAGLTAVPAL